MPPAAPRRAALPRWGQAAEARRSPTAQAPGAAQGRGAVHAAGVRAPETRPQCPAEPGHALKEGVLRTVGIDAVFAIAPVPSCCFGPHRFPRFQAESGALPETPTPLTCKDRAPLSNVSARQAWGCLVWTGHTRLSVAADPACPVAAGGG